MNIAFERPVFAVMAIIAPFILILIRRFVRDAFSLKISLGPPGGESFTPSLSWYAIAKILRIMEIAAVSLFLVAASGPLVITRDLIWLERGSDILFVLDCSPSMAGLDMNGRNRFDTSRDLLKNFAQNRPACAIGLVAVGNDAALLIPPTIDRSALFNRLENLYIGELGDGTALGMGLALAALHLRDSQAKQKAVVLITDGENNAGSVHPIAAVQALQSEGVALYVLAIGSIGEVPIDYVDPVTRVRRTGVFESHFNPENLKLLAEAGGGTFILAPSPASFEAAFQTVNKREATVSPGAVQDRKTSIREPLLFAALLLVFSVYLIRNIFLGSFL